MNVFSFFWFDFRYVGTPNKTKTYKIIASRAMPQKIKQMIFSITSVKSSLFPRTLKFHQKNAGTIKRVSRTEQTERVSNANLRTFLAISPQPQPLCAK
jgi:hypothetical protein